ncbi:MAG: transcriptional repressor [Phenylobacterium sp.]|uniref:Fur family transcriptional regulator n=1 Tax=Phenylobacterium sp. TaxID=1871053 RepID=UPI0018593A3E|nr:Fur family transcriptional regulator [Phenylobacterium sp.]MBA4793444.1 transcriptional repressor [Phenylobacterium sp.]
MLGCSHFHGTRSTLKAVAAALAEAEQVCLAAGDRWTASRRRTYELLVQAGGPVKAYDLISAYATEGEPVAKPPTVYRALEFLTGKGLVHRIESLNAFLACDAQHDGAAAEFLICDCCGRVEELDVGMQDLAAAAVNARGFRPTRIVLEVHGTCAGCV